MTDKLLMSALQKSSDLEGPSGAPPEFLREADADLIARLLRGIIPYLILLLTVGATTDYRREHSLFFWGFAAAVVTSMGIRVALARLRERVHMLSPKFRNAAFAAAVGLASGAAGLVHASTLFFFSCVGWR